jgi:hypothetical protein
MKYEQLGESLDWKNQLQNFEKLMTDLDSLSWRTFG